MQKSRLPFRSTSVIRHQKTYRSFAAPISLKNRKRQMIITARQIQGSYLKNPCGVSQDVLFLKNSTYSANPAAVPTVFMIRSSISVLRLFRSWLSSMIRDSRAPPASVQAKLFFDPLIRGNSNPKGIKRITFSPCVTIFKFGSEKGRTLICSGRISNPYRFKSNTVPAPVTLSTTKTYNANIISSIICLPLDPMPLLLRADRNASITIKAGTITVSSSYPNNTILFMT